MDSWKAEQVRALTEEATNNRWKAVRFRTKPKEHLGGQPNRSSTKRVTARCSTMFTKLIE